MDRDEKLVCLKHLYEKNSKHSQYQSLPRSLRKMFPDIAVATKWEQERMEYISRVLDITDKKLLDIGGNTGYFSFEAIERGAESVDYYDGNQIHADFVKLAAEVLKIQNLNVCPKYYLFSEESLLKKVSSEKFSVSQKKYDITFCLNVVHHFGDDYGEASDINVAKKKMLTCINSLSKVSTWLVFQMGFNWCGNREKPLFPNGLKDEMKQFVGQGTKGNFNIVKIGVPVRRGDVIVYEDENTENRVRDDLLGEFLNRPLFIMKAVD